MHKTWFYFWDEQSTTYLLLWSLWYSNIAVPYRLGGDPRYASMGRLMERYSSTWTYLPRRNTELHKSNVFHCPAPPLHRTPCHLHASTVERLQQHRQRQHARQGREPNVNIQCCSMCAPLNGQLVMLCFLLHVHIVDATPLPHTPCRVLLACVAPSENVARVQQRCLLLCFLLCLVMEQKHATPTYLHPVSTTLHIPAVVLDLQSCRGRKGRSFPE